MSLAFRDGSETYFYPFAIFFLWLNYLTFYYEKFKYMHT